MDFTIYTTGSAEFLEIMLNACAMIVGSGDAEDLARIGALMGLLLLGFQAVFSNQAITFQKVGLVLVLYMMFYGPTATTVIEDTVSGQARVVDNVPLGPAFVGSVISTVAYGITKTTEQAFSTPAMTSYGLFSSLSTLSKVRDALRNPMALDSFQNYNRNSGWDLPRTINEYMTYCSLSPVALRNDKTLAELYRSSGWKQLMDNRSVSMYVMVYDGTNGKEGSLKSCADAQLFLTQHVPAVYREVLGDIVQKGFAEEAKSNRITNGDQVEEATRTAIQNLAMSSKSAQDYVTTSLIAPIFADSRVDALNHWQEQRAALALQESLNQQEIQWAGKGDSFKHYMRPMIAFFEGLLYAMTPFMAFALLLGSPGLSILGKYLVLPLAVGLWMPLLSIVNAFTLWYAGSQMEAVFNGYDPTSDGFAMLQLQDMDKVIGKALGIGGLLSASVPPLALFIVSGSAMVANSVMSQMTSAEKFRSEDVTPRAQETKAVLGTQTAHTSDQMSRGAYRTGAPEQAEVISVEHAASSLVQSTSAASQSATSQYQESLKAAGQQLTSTATGRQAMAQIGENLSSGSVLSSNASYTGARETLRGLGISESSINQATASAALGFSTPIGGLNRSDNTSADSMTQENRVQAQKALAQLTKSVQSTDSNTLTFATGDAFTNSSLAQNSTSNTDELSKTRSNALQAQEAFNRASADQSTIKAGQSLKLKDAGVKALRFGLTGNEDAGVQQSRREESSRVLEKMAGRTESGKRLYDAAFASVSIQDMSGDISERRAMAAIRAMNQEARLGELLTSPYNPFDFKVRQGDAHANAGLVEDTAKATEGNQALPGKFQSKWASNASEHANTDDMNRSGYQSTKQDGALVVQQRNEANQKAVERADNANMAHMEAQGSQMAYEGLTERGKAAREGVNMARYVAEGANGIVAGVSTISSLFRSGESDERTEGYYNLGIAQGLHPVEAQYFAAKATFEFGANQGDAYRELSSFYRSQGIRDENYIAGAITAIDDAAKAPDSGSYATLAALGASRDAARTHSTQEAQVRSLPNEDVPRIGTEVPQGKPVGEQGERGALAPLRDNGLDYGSHGAPSAAKPDEHAQASPSLTRNENGDAVAPQPKVSEHVNGGPRQAAPKPSQRPSAVADQPSDAVNANPRRPVGISTD